MQYLKNRIDTTKNFVIYSGFAKIAQRSFFHRTKIFSLWMSPLALIWQNTSITSLGAPYQMDMWGGAKRIWDTFKAVSQVNQTARMNEPNFTFKWHLVITGLRTISVSGFRSSLIAWLPIPANFETWKASVMHIHFCCCQTRVIHSTQSNAHMSKCSVYGVQIACSVAKRLCSSH